MKKTINIAQLPDDMQVLIWEMVETSQSTEILNRLKNHRFRVSCIPLNAFPDIAIGTDYRNEEYARSMMYTNLPPIIVCGSQLLDGRHRVWVSKAMGAAEIPAIDLAEIGFVYNFPPLCTIEQYR